MKSTHVLASVEPNVPIAPSPDHEERVRARAYELYEDRGKEDGHAIEDWLQAEQEVLGTKSFAEAA